MARSLKTSGGIADAAVRVINDLDSGKITPRAAQARIAELNRQLAKMKAAYMAFCRMEKKLPPATVSSYSADLRALKKFAASKKRRRAK